MTTMKSDRMARSKTAMMTRLHAEEGGRTYPGPPLLQKFAAILLCVSTKRKSLANLHLCSYQRRTTPHPVHSSHSQAVKRSWPAQWPSPTYFHSVAPVYEGDRGVKASVPAYPCPSSTSSCQPLLPAFCLCSSPPFNKYALSTFWGHCHWKNNP